MPITFKWAPGARVRVQASGRWWQVDRVEARSTIREYRLTRDDGEVATCSEDELDDGPGYMREKVSAPRIRADMIRLTNSAGGGGNLAAWVALPIQGICDNGEFRTVYGNGKCSVSVRESDSEILDLIELAERLESQSG